MKYGNIFGDILRQQPVICLRGLVDVPFAFSVIGPNIWHDAVTEVGTYRLLLSEDVGKAHYVHVNLTVTRVDNLAPEGRVMTSNRIPASVSHES